MSMDTLGHFAELATWKVFSSRNTGSPEPARFEWPCKVTKFIDKDGWRLPLYRDTVGISDTQ